MEGTPITQIVLNILFFIVYYILYYTLTPAFETADSHSNPYGRHARRNGQ